MQLFSLDTALEESATSGVCCRETNSATIEPQSLDPFTTPTAVRLSACPNLSDTPPPVQLVASSNMLSVGLPDETLEASTVTEHEPQHSGALTTSTSTLSTAGTSVPTIAGDKLSSQVKASSLTNNNNHH